MRAPRLARVALLTAAAALPSCHVLTQPDLIHPRSGAFFTKATLPFDTNLRATPVQPAEGESDSKTVTFSGVDVQWGESGLVQAAREGGLVEIDYADVETFSVMRYFTKREMRVVGTTTAR